MDDTLRRWRNGTRARVYLRPCRAHDNFGGGTPSLVPPATLQHLVDRARETFDCSGVEEITVEANPDDVPTDMSGRCATRISTASLGIQSFDDAELCMNRHHTAARGRAVGRSQDAGYGNITIDIIFGVDGFGGRYSSGTLERGGLGVQHVSACSPTFEPGDGIRTAPCAG